MLEWQATTLEKDDLMTSVDKSWQLGGTNNPLYWLYDWLRRGLNGRITAKLADWGLQQRGIVIEAGSGTGFASGLLAQHPQAQLSIALDYDLEALREGRKENPALVAVVADVHHLPFGPQTAQLIWNSSTIEHLPDQQRVVQEMARVVKAGGVVYVGVPYQRGPLFFQRWIPNSTVGVWLGTVYGQADVERWLEVADCQPIGQWAYFFRFFIGVAGRKRAN